MQESRTYGSGRGACDETRVPTATDVLIDRFWANRTLSPGCEIAPHHPTQPREFRCDKLELLGKAHTRLDKSRAPSKRTGENSNDNEA
jgi:hypothetical protein